MPTPQKILDLIATFERNVGHYTSTGYKEAMVRQQFIDPFFDALGWDMENRQGHAPDYQDVIHEDAIKIGGATKAPDYSFGIGKDRKFFVEAKKPSVKIKDDADAAYQLRRYAWSKKLPLSILTNFREFAVYDGRTKPAQTDKASVARVRYFTLADYPQQWDDLAAVFSKDAVLKGSFDKFADTAKAKRGTTAVDAAFLAEIESWRVDLAKNIALRNPDLSQRDLNYAVQVTIDRIIFLRMCEDRGIEDYGRLRDLNGEPDIYDQLLALFRQADRRYNSGLFYFKRDAAHPDDQPDTLTPGLAVDDKPLKEIIGGLYYPESPYEFSVLPAEILGQVYEQFLGKVIRLTAGHQAKVEDKPEVKKAGGVYYTPKYIVDYIVKHTVGKLLREPGPSATGVTPKQAAKLRILDPACGSGSFLLGAYEYLLDWHRRWYENHDPEKQKAVYRTPAGWRLTTAEKKRILLANIYGVDIDPQAVEVTKLSLLLKVLEGESQDTLQKHLFDHQERALPDLASNIKCGNSLIGPDFYEGQQLTMFDEEERYRINVFDWTAAFPAIMKGGGFDAVIGNPPYGAYVGESETDYLRSRYESPANSLDTFLLFVEKSATRLAKNGLLGMIIPSGWTSTPSALPLRDIFIRLFQPMSFVSLPFDVFAGAYIDTVILTARRMHKSPQPRSDRVELVVFPARFKITSADDFVSFERRGSFSTWTKTKNREFLITCSNQEAELLIKVQNQSATVDDVVLVKRGIETYDPVPIKSGLANPQPALVGKLQRYLAEDRKVGFVSYPPDVEKSKPIEYFSGERILLRQVLSRKLRLQATLAERLFLTNQSVQSLVQKDGAKSISLHCLLGVLNSRLISWFFRNINSVARRDDFPKIIIQQTRELPLPSFDSAQAKSRHDHVVQLVETMLALHQQLAKAKSPPDQAALQAQIAGTDRQIDQLVYELYGLTDAEIRIVEEGTAK